LIRLKNKLYVNHLISFVDLTTCNSEDYKCSDEGHNYEKKTEMQLFLAEGKTFCFVFFCVKWMQTLTYIYAHTSISTSEKKKIGPTDRVTYYRKNNAIKSCNKSTNT